MAAKRSLATALLLPLLLCTAPAWADKLDDDLQTVWESLWDQRGTTLPVLRWDREIRYRVFGPDSARHREHAVTALQAAAQESGLQLKDVSDEPDAEKTAMLDLEVVKDFELQDNEPCLTAVTELSNWAFLKVKIRMRSRDAWRCTYHEVMHAMGIRGHPSGKTVLSYFPYRRDSFMDLDRLMLRAWYSPSMRKGATPFEALVVLSRAVAGQTDLGILESEAQTRASAFRLAKFREMEALASGNGEIPAIVKRSGKTSSEHMKNAQREAGYYLGVAYLLGIIVSKDETVSSRWFKHAAEQGQTAAQVMWGRALAKGTGVEVDQQSAYAWFSQAKRGGNSVAQNDLAQLEKVMSPEDLEKARARLPGPGKAGE
ncbi:MAG: tetratricopeptide repeat protein [Polaromonas sp.]